MRGERGEIKNCSEIFGESSFSSEQFLFFRAAVRLCKTQIFPVVLNACGIDSLTLKRVYTEGV